MLGFCKPAEEKNTFTEPSAVDIKARVVLKTTHVQRPNKVSGIAGGW